MATVLEQLEAMRSVPENWDGYGAAAPRGDIIESAIEFWRSLQGRPALRDPYVTPTRIGGVLFDWEHGPHQLEVEFEGGSKAVFVYLNRETDESATGSVILRREKPPASLAFDALLSAMPATV
ncbi:MAG: hypothetical protein K2W96_13970 [Gemmataceae bacterium]|nr:hypothetical protein [Gemmataceae bacterium]